MNYLAAELARYQLQTAGTPLQAARYLPKEDNKTIHLSYYEVSRQRINCRISRINYDLG